MTKDRPILFSGPMVRALLDGTKTQTRRIVKITHRTPGLAACLEPADPTWARPNVAAMLCPYGEPGDRLWVRETHRKSVIIDHRLAVVVYAADGANNVWHCEPADGTWLAGPTEKPIKDSRWTTSIHMPRWASRITLEITEIRAQRLWQDLTEQDAIAEGVKRNVNGDGSWSEDDGWLDYESLAKDSEGFPAETARDSYASLWRSLHGTKSWESNPWVWAITFKLADPESKTT